jgi:hypothetical protein
MGDGRFDAVWHQRMSSFGEQTSFPRGNRTLDGWVRRPDDDGAIGAVVIAGPFAHESLMRPIERSGHSPRRRSPAVSLTKTSGYRVGRFAGQRAARDPRVRSTWSWQ